MRLYLDQMLGEGLAERLRKAGHDVVRACERGQERAQDSEILDQAIAEGRVLITLDAHFGDWAVLPLGAHSGVIRVRAHPPKADVQLEVLEPLLAAHDQEDFTNRLVIASSTRQRWIETD